jgi:capsular polysaccharide transport system permease protein
VADELGDFGYISPRRAWFDAGHTQLRVIGALVRREMRVHFGERRLGYLWAVLEPALHLFVLTTLFIYVFHRHVPIRSDFRLFFLSGLIPYFLYYRTASSMTSAVSGNRNILRLPAVKIFDVVLARGLVEFSTELTVGVVLFAGLYLFGVSEALPRDPLIAIEATLVILTFSFGVGMINIVLSAYIVNWSFIFGTFFGPLYLLSGIFFVVEEVPPPFRDYLLYNPAAHFLIWFRMAFYSDYPHTFLDRSYVIWVAVACLTIGLVLLRATRRKLLEPE